MNKFLPFLFLLILTAIGCKKTDPTPTVAKLRFKFHFDSTQTRLNNLGQPNNTLPAGHAGQNPVFRKMSVHYVEFAPTMFTALGSGAVLYHAPETTAGGANAIDFAQETFAGQDEVFLEIPLKDITPGTYNWVRASVAYQNYDVKFNVLNVPILGSQYNQTGTVASFLGFNTYVTSVSPRSLNLSVNAAKLQGFWAFETALTAPLSTYVANTIYSGQAPAGATTVVNPLASSSPIPAGSCVVTGQFASPVTITGTETSDVNVTLSFSTNRSFEWIDTNGNGQLDVDASSNTIEQIVDMGIRGLVPIKN